MNNLQTPAKIVSSKVLLIALGIAAIVATVYFFTSRSNHKKHEKINPAFASYISAHTAGIISRDSRIRIQLAGNFSDSSKIGSIADVFEFSPKIKGEAKWVDASTLEFKPAEPMKSGEKYEGIFYLKSILAVPDELEEFPFHFSIIEQSFEVSYPVFESIDPTRMIYQRVSGNLLTADSEDDKKTEELLHATHDGKSFHIKWEHAADKRTHRYIIDSVVRKATASEMLLTWDGSPLDIKLKGEHKIEIPAIGDFKVMSAQVVNDGAQYISVYFSDPILASQDLSGLIYFDKSNNAATTNTIDLKFTIDGNLVKCYPGITLNGSQRLTVMQGIQNILGFKLKHTQTFDLDFVDLLPSVKFLGKGVIMPASNKLYLPFEAVGLNAVDVTIIKIYENNIAQFFQVNDMNGSNQLARVGRPLIKKTIRLDTDKLTDLHKSNHFAIDLDDMIKAEQGAIYQVKITFKKAYSLYRCDNDKQADAKDDGMQTIADENWDGENQNEESNWDEYEGNYSSDYNWNERDNPCHNSYYTNARWVTRNVMASDLGIIAKKGSSKEYLFAVTNLITTQTVSGVTIELLDYQQQVITTALTDNEGLVKVSTERKPFLAVAKFKDQRAYLKLDDGSSLPISQFDVSGDVVQKGLKGFIYGERGVWRPGDSVYLTFILEDRNKTLPAMHPVSFELFDPNGGLYSVRKETLSCQ